MIKHLGGIVLLAADALFGTAMPAVFRNLHHESRVHLYAAAGIYGVLALLTLTVIVSAVRRTPEKKKPAQRQPVYPYGNRQR